MSGEDVINMSVHDVWWIGMMGMCIFSRSECEEGENDGCWIVSMDIGIDSREECGGLRMSSNNIAVSCEP